MVAASAAGTLPPRSLRYADLHRVILDSWPLGPGAHPVSGLIAEVEAEYRGLPEPSDRPGAGFRIALREDAPRIVDLVNAAYRGVGGRKGWTTEEHLVEGMRIEREELLAMMADPSSTFLLAVNEKGEILGSVHLRREPESTCYLGMLSVDPGGQAAGVGRALLEESELLAIAWGCARMRITVLEVRHELLAYYARRGYELTGRSHEFPTSDRSRPKVAGLRLVELMKPLP